MKKIVMLLIAILIALPISGNALKLAKGYTNLEETIKIAGIAKNKSGYTPKNDDVEVILFYGNGCPHCQHFVEFLNSFNLKYDHIDLKAYETWYDTDNQKFLSDVAKELNIEIRGVPFIIVGKKTFVGFGDSNQKDIEDAIKTLYETPVDQRESYFETTKKTTTTTTKTTTAVQGTVTNAMARTTEQKNNSGKQINMYIFHGDGCPHCADLDEFVTNKLVKDDRVKGYLNIVYYETWYNSTNQKFLEELGKELGITISGVPFVVIGDEYFSGYGSTMDESIVSKIVDVYNKSNYDDVVATVAKKAKITPVSSKSLESEPKTDNNNSNKNESTLTTGENTKDDNTTEEKSFFDKYKYVIIGGCVLIIGIFACVVIVSLKK